MVSSVDKCRQFGLLTDAVRTWPHDASRPPGVGPLDNDRSAAIRLDVPGLEWPRCTW